MFDFSEGKVVKLTHESIHVVVLGFASAVITEKDIRKEFVYRTVSFSPDFLVVATVLCLHYGYVI